jgi:hypothetical protein
MSRNKCRTELEKTRVSVVMHEPNDSRINTDHKAHQNLQENVINYQKVTATRQQAKAIDLSWRCKSQ